MISCPKCNATLPDDAKFCDQCGSKIEKERTCPNCGRKLPNNAKFCLSCGTNCSEEIVSPKNQQGTIVHHIVEKTQKPKKKRKYWRWILIAILTILVASFVEDKVTTYLVEKDYKGKTFSWTEENYVTYTIHFDEEHGGEIVNQSNGNIYDFAWETEKTKSMKYIVIRVLNNTSKRYVYEGRIYRDILKAKHKDLDGSYQLTSWDGNNYSVYEGTEASRYSDAQLECEDICCMPEKKDETDEEEYLNDQARQDGFIWQEYVREGGYPELETSKEDDEVVYKERESGTANGHEWIDLGLPSGTKWATMNVGASSPSDYGNYYAWGETSTKTSYTWDNLKYCLNSDGDKFSKYVTNSEYGNVDGKKELDPNDDAAYVNWGSSWRMPSSNQQDELREECEWTWTTIDGHDGYKVVGHNGNSIFLPAAGSYWNNRLEDEGSIGSYWSRSLFADIHYDTTARIFDFSSNRVGRHKNSGRNYGHSVRAVLAQ